MTATPLLIPPSYTAFSFIGTSGQDWNTASHWNTSLVPTVGDTVNITQSPTSLFSVTFDGSYTSLTAISSLTLDGSSTVGVVLTIRERQQTTSLPATRRSAIPASPLSIRPPTTNSFAGVRSISGTSSGSQGTYLLGSGSASLVNTANDNVYVEASPGCALLQANRAASASFFSLFLAGSSKRAGGLYSLSPGGTLTVSSLEYVGYGGAGTFTQSGGTHTSSSWLYMGYFSGSGGAYVLSGGTLAAYQESVGYQGVGTFAQSGGTHSITNFLTVGDQPIIGSQTAGVGIYTLSAGLLSAPSENVAYSGTGTFVQTGGTNSTSNLVVASQTSSVGSYSLSGTGVLNANSGLEIVGDQAVGHFNQSGGSNNLGASGRLWLAAMTGSQGVYNLSGGSLSGQAATVGGGSVAGGTGTLNVSGTGSLTLTGELAVFNNGSSINFSGGSITASDLNTLNVPANFSWTAGSLNLSGSNVVFDSSASGTSASLGSTLTLASGQTLQLSNGSETIGGSGPGSLTLKGGSTNTVSGSATVNPLGTLTLTGGNLNTSGTLVNLGNLVYNSGAINGRLVNLGAVNLAPTANFGPSNGIENDTTMTVAVGQTLTVNGSGLDNLGTFTLGGGAIAGVGAVVNDYGALMTVSGTINQGLTNNGTLYVNGLLTQSAASTNVGQINVPTASQLRGGSLSNSGFLTLSGGAVSSATSNGTGGVIQGYGSITSFQGNNSGGQISVSSNLGPLTINGAWNNAGLVTLQGAGTVLSGSAITNAGTDPGQRPSQSRHGPEPPLAACSTFWRPARFCGARQ